MTVNRTTLLDLPLPVTGTESGAWGDITNNGLTQYLDIAIAGTLVLNTDADVTLTSTEGDSSATYIGATTAQYAILRWTATGSTTRNITALAQSKTYVVINATGGTQSIVLRGAGPTTGVTIISGEKALCVWNGSDFVKVSSSAAAGGSNTQVQYNSSGVLAGVSGATTNGTAITFSTTNLKLQGSSTGVSSFASANSSATDYTVTFPAASTTIPIATQTLTFSGPTAARTITLPDANFTAARTDAAQTFTGTQTFSSDPVLSGGTANGVLYLNGSKVATSGSALTYNGTLLTIGGVSAGVAALLIPAGDITSDVSSGAFAVGNYGDTSSELRLSTRGFTTFRTGATDGTNGSEQMRLTSTGLGIGTSSPAYKLDVDATSSANAIQANSNDLTYGVSINLKYNGTAIGQIGSSKGIDSTGNLTDLAFNSVANLDFATGYTRRMRLDSSGNLGLGVTPSAWGGSFKAFQIASGGTSLWSDGTVAFYNRNTYYNGTNRIYTVNGYAQEYAQLNDGSHAWKVAASGTAGNAITFSQVMTLDASGNLGIGQTSMSQPLEIKRGAGVASFIEVAGNNNTPGSTSAVYGQDSSGNAFAWNRANLPLLFGTNNTERARITSGGDFGLGVIAPAARMDIYSDSVTAATPIAFMGKALNDSTTSNVLVKFLINSGGTGSGQINANGASAAAFGTYSDERLKENIVTLPTQIAKICALRPVEFDYKDGSGHQIGFIAQEMQSVYSDCVGEDSEGMLTITGWSKTEARLVKAIQEQQALITSLTARVALLEGN